MRPNPSSTLAPTTPKFFPVALNRATESDCDSVMIETPPGSPYLGTRASDTELPNVPQHNSDDATLQESTPTVQQPSPTKNNQANVTLFTPPPSAQKEDSCTCCSCCGEGGFCEEMGSVFTDCCIWIKSVFR